MSERPLCLSTDACKAKTPGRHCSRCANAVRNRTPEARAAVAAAARRHRVLARPEVQALAHSPENVARATETRLKTWMAKDAEERRQHAIHAARARTAWCPPSYREMYDRLTTVCRAAEARRLVEEQMAIDGKRQVARIRSEMIAKHQRDLASRY